MLVLALESSTSSAKALLYDSERGVVAMESSPYDPSFSKDGVTGTEEVFKLTAEMGERVAAGKDAVVEGTPSFFVNGQLMPGPATFDSFKLMIDAELKRLGR